MFDYNMIRQQPKEAMDDETVPQFGLKKYSDAVYKG